MMSKCETTSYERESKSEDDETKVADLDWRPNDEEEEDNKNAAFSHSSSTN